MCPWYDVYNKRCKLHEHIMNQSDRTRKCETNNEWRKCGDAEAKASGKMYQNKP
jgi:hypothetical protein